MLKKSQINGYSDELTNIQFVGYSYNLNGTLRGTSSIGRHSPNFKQRSFGFPLPDGPNNLGATSPRLFTNSGVVSVLWLAYMIADLLHEERYISLE
jgi:hypothetical protein